MRAAPSAAAPSSPVTTTRSPGRAPERTTAWLTSPRRVRSTTTAARQQLDRILVQSVRVGSADGPARLVLQDDGSAVLERWLHQEMEALQGQHEVVLESLVTLLPEGLVLLTSIAFAEQE